jgi:hypothetical protein
MRMIYEENIEHEDFIEIILSPEEAKYLCFPDVREGGTVDDFPLGLWGARNLNVCVRTDLDYHNKEDDMPFKSKAQQRYLYAKEPQVAEEFAEHTPKSAYKKMPEHVKKKPLKKAPKKAIERAKK